MSVASNLINFFSGKSKDKEIDKKGKTLSKSNVSSAQYFNYYSKLESSNEQKRCCLYEKGKVVPLFSVEEMTVHAEVYDTCCITVITQKYINGLNTPVEARYQLPLPSYAAVSNFLIEYDGKSYQGKVKEKEKAQNKYSDQIASGGQAFLGEKSSDGFFTINVGNLPPAKNVTVSCTVVSEIGNHLDSLHYCLHKFMFPPGSYSFNFDLKVNLSVPIKEIELIDSGSFKVKPSLSSNKNEANLTFKSNSGCQNSIITVITPQLTNSPAYYIEKRESTIAASINFYPKLEINPDDIDQKSEFIFLLDCSGSMSGGPIAQAKKALQIIMRSLTENHKFNIYTFGSSFKKMFAQSKIYDDASLEEASTAINKIDANLGGTELLPPIQDILKSEYDPEYPRQVFILTDGEVSNREDLIDYVGRESNTTRIFTLGIGSGVDIKLVTGLSKACKGYYEFINDNKTMEANVLKLLAIAFEPTISNIKLNFGTLPEGCTATQAPSFVRPLYNGERMVLSCLFEGVPATTKNIDVTLTGNGPTGQQVSYPVQIDLTSQNNLLNGTSHIHQLAALNMINDLEVLENKLKTSNSDKIIKISKEYGIISKYTSFIVTIDSDQPTQETMKAVDVQQKEVNLLSESLMARRSSLNSHSSGASDGDWDDGDEEDEEDEESSGSEDEEEDDRKVVKNSSIKGSQPVRNLSMKKSMMYDDHLDTGIEKCEMEVEKCDVFQEKERDGFSQSSMSVDKKESFKRKKMVSSLPPPKPQKLSSPPPQQSSAPQLASGKKQTTGDLLLDLIQAQKANGSWTSDSLPFTIPNAPSELSSLDSIVFTTLIVISKIVNTYPNDSPKWDLIIKKASKWVKSQLTKTNFTSISYDDLLKKCKSLAK